MRLANRVIAKQRGPMFEPWGGSIRTSFCVLWISASVYQYDSHLRPIHQHCVIRVSRIQELHMHLSPDFLFQSAWWVEKTTSRSLTGRKKKGGRGGGQRQLRVSPFGVPNALRDCHPWHREERLTTESPIQTYAAFPSCLDPGGDGTCGKQRTQGQRK